MKRHNGDGTVYPQPNGKFQARLMLGGVRRNRTFATEREAWAAIRQWQLEAAKDGGLAAPGDRTLADLCAAWLESATLRETTRAHYRAQLALHVLPELGGVKLARLTPDRIQRLYARMKPVTAAHVHRILHRALAVGARWRWLSHNPADMVERPRHRAKRPDVWTADQLRAFVAACAGHPQGDLFTVLATSGLRLGEALAMTWADVGPAGVSVNVNGTFRAGVTNPPKTAAGRRTVMLPPAARDALARRMAEAGDPAPTDRIFPTTARAAQKAMQTLCARLGLPRLTPHGLRHCHASALLAEGVPVPEVAGRLGHAHSGITLSIYAHSMGGQTASIAALERILEVAR